MKAKMQFALDELAAPLRYKLLTATVVPRPIAWVTSCDADGVVNAAPYSFFNVMGHEPAIVVLGVLGAADKRLKDTASNIERSGEFVVNLVNESSLYAMNQTAANLPAGQSEIERAGLTTSASVRVAPPRIDCSPVSFECRLLQSVPVSEKQRVIIAEALFAHIDEQYVLDAERMYIDTPQLALIGRMHGSGKYCRAVDSLEVARPD